ncbi:hypothetical protein KR009_008669, partial [Drosophila setifemur]
QKLFLVAFAVIAAVAADVSHLPSNEYLPPVVQEAQITAAPSNEYLPPVAQEVEAEPAHVLADDGYRYKTHKRVVIRRHRRDVNELSNEYLPPVQAAPSNEYLAPVEAAQETVLADDGYRYKTHKRVVVRRHRRDVNELANEYLPPVQAAAPLNEYLPPVQVESEPETVLADDGYRYKTHKRVVVRRHRRDVNELSNEYLPPVQAAPSNEYLAPVEAAPETVLADDGYRYKTHKRVVVRRHRRDVSHLPSNEYLPPVQAAAPTNEYLPPVAAAPAPVPVQVAAPIQYAAAPAPAPVEIEAEPAHVLADDGYRYKTHKRVVIRRHRRDVNELSNEYLPPVQEAAAPSNEYLAPVEAPETVLADDGYRYKTHKRVVIRRHRRDVNELSNEYLPPVAAPSNEYLAPVEAAQETVLADDGYRYKTHKRVVVRRHRRDVNELSNEYLPPVQAAPSNEYLAPVENTVEVAPAHVLADDGYRYKTHKRVVIRRH